MFFILGVGCFTIAGMMVVPVGKSRGLSGDEEGNGKLEAPAAAAWQIQKADRDEESRFFDG